MTEGKCNMNQKERIIEMHTDIKWIKNTLSGNGSKGLIEDVNDIKSWKSRIVGIAVGISIVGSIIINYMGWFIG